SGIKTVYWLQQFQSIFKQLMAEAQGIYFNTNEHLRANTEVETREDRFIKKTKTDYPAHQVYKAAPILHKIRSVKENLEIDLMQQACNITESGFRRLLSFIKPGVWEYEIEAELAHEFLRNRSKGFAYTPIVASGKNACVLHYIENNQQCKDGDVILLDVGAEYANYSSDLTRCVPVNGRFTSRQKEVYNAVLHVKNEAQKLLVPGTIMAEYHKQVGVLMEEQLVNLGLISLNDIKNQS
ncbi:MAG: M24 family metallopeptidase, partial [Crocinitomicaceae bacterium]